MKEVLVTGGLIPVQVLQEEEGKVNFEAPQEGRISDSLQEEESFLSCASDYKIEIHDVDGGTRKEGREKGVDKVNGENDDETGRRQEGCRKES